MWNGNRPRFRREVRRQHHEAVQKDLDRLGRRRGATGLPAGRGTPISSGHRFFHHHSGRFHLDPAGHRRSSRMAGGDADDLRLDLSAYQYARNSVKKLPVIRCRSRRTLHPGKAPCDLGRASYGFLPRFYQRNLSQRPHGRRFRADGDLHPSPPRREATYRSESAEVQIDQVHPAGPSPVPGEPSAKKPRLQSLLRRAGQATCRNREAELAWNPRGSNRLRLRALLRPGGAARQGRSRRHRRLLRVRHQQRPGRSGETCASDGTPWAGRVGGAALRDRTARLQGQGPERPLSPSAGTTGWSKRVLRADGPQRRMAPGGGGRHQSNKSTFPAPFGITTRVKRSRITTTTSFRSDSPIVSSHRARESESGNRLPKRLPGRATGGRREPRRGSEPRDAAAPESGDPDMRILMRHVSPRRSRPRRTSVPPRISTLTSRPRRAAFLLVAAGTSCWASRQKSAETGQRRLSLRGRPPLLKNADIVLANLEGPLARKSAREARNYFLQGESPSCRRARARADRGLTLANNHAARLRARGVLRRWRRSRRPGPVRSARAPTGGGRTGLLSDRRALAGRSFGLLLERALRRDGRSPGRRDGDTGGPCGRHRRSTRQGGSGRVTYHWGVPYYVEPSPENRARARLAVDCGADVVIGHHPHRPAVRDLSRLSIFYSVGNFTFGSRNSHAEGFWSRSDSRPR